MFFFYCRVQLENRVLLGPQALKDPRYEGINIYFRETAHLPLP